jgi:hypothetical protein
MDILVDFSSELRAPVGFDGGVNEGAPASWSV